MESTFDNQSTAPTSTMAPVTTARVGARSELRTKSYAEGQAMLRPKGHEADSATSDPEAVAVPETPAAAGERSRRIYFAIAYIVDDAAFERAAQTWAREIQARGDFDGAQDLVVVQTVQTEGGFRTVWDQVKTSGDTPGWVVQEGQVFSHASKGGNNTGLEFRRGEAEAGTNDDGTLSQAEITTLPALNWASDGHLWLSSCNSGMEGERGWSPAEAFASGQGVRTSGEMGYAYFSSDPDSYQRIDGDTEDVYLNAYRRGQNAWFGSGAAVEDGEYTP
ncbi:MAG: hypothetical protein ACI9OJ_001943 [Myxococcota bacterium]